MAETITEVAFYPPCRDSRECFAQCEFRGKKKCSTLTDTLFKSGVCPFNKKVAIVTNGKEYPITQFYKTKGEAAI